MRQTNAALAATARMEDATSIREMATIWQDITTVDSLNDLQGAGPGLYATKHDLVAVYADGRRADVASIPDQLSERAWLVLTAMRHAQADDTEITESARGQGPGRPVIGPRISARVLPAQSRALRRYARREGIRQAEAVRRLLDIALAQQNT
ncbi:hypothetical protein [Salinispora arenicola]|uniref:hypothetical protein n=1 Tax=Salinispora arenicola TaxID=168697 RepID=UPI000380998C|nr:hypothetical protein [Salinispora arenicola]